MNYPSEMQQKMDAMSAGGTISGANFGARMQDVISQMPVRDDRPPVEVSMSRLMERLSQLRAEVDQLTARLNPVSRMDTTAGHEGTKRVPSECPLVDGLEQVSEGMEKLIGHLSMARARLCI